MHKQHWMQIFLNIVTRLRLYLLFVAGSLSHI